MGRLAGILAAVVVAGCAARSDESPRALLPDLDQGVPYGVALRHDGERQLLVFGSTVDNVGEGPLVVAARRSTRADDAMSAVQRIRRADGSSVGRALRTMLRYEAAETHAHWHLEDFESYELRWAADLSLVARPEKAGFCLGDRYDSRASARLPAEPASAVWRHECGRGEPDLLALTQGISVGYGDDYAPRLEGQFVDVTRLAAGRYVLVHRANPDRALRESEYANNAASVLVQLDRPPSGAPPRLDVVMRCPDSERCPSA